MPVAEVLADKGASAVGKVTAIDLLRGVVQLMAIPDLSAAFFPWIHSTSKNSQMLRSRVALPTTILGTGELLVEAFAAPASLWRITLTPGRVIFVSI
jgi:hypothetical protein